MTLQEVFKKMQPGDIILEKGTDFLAECIAHFDRANYCHTLIYLGKKEVIHAGLAGVHTLGITDALCEAQYFQVFRLKDTNVDIQQVIEKGKSYIGAMYGHSHMLLLALILLSDRISYPLRMSKFARKVLENATSILVSFKGRNKSMICSEFAYRAYNESEQGELIKVDRNNFYKNERSILDDIDKPYSFLEVDWGTNNSIQSEVIEGIEELKQLYQDGLKDKGIITREFLTPEEEALEVAKINFKEAYNELFEKDILSFEDEEMTRGAFTDFITFLKLDGAKFVTPGDLAESESLIKVFEKPIRVNNTPF